MRASWTVIALVALAAPPAFAQDDFELAEGVSARGWFDLSEELLKKVEGSSSYSAEQRAEAKYGLARLTSQRAEREGDPKKKAEYYDTAINAIIEFTKNFPKHPRASDALSDVGYLYQQKGKFLLTTGRTDADAPKKAEEAFGKAESLFSDLIKSLNEKKPERTGDQDKVYEEWNHKLMMAKYNYGISLFAHAEALKERPDGARQMKELLDQMVNFFEKDFMWEYEAYLTAYDAFVYMGRGFQLLAETSDGAKADENWKKCFNYIGKAKGLLADKELRKDEGVRDVAMRAYFYEIKARMVYGDSRKGGAATKQYLECAKLAEDLFKMLPKAGEDIAKAIRLEQGRAYFKAGKATEGKALLTLLAKENKDTWIESVAIDILGEYAGETDVRLAIDAADNIFDRGGAFLYQAIGKYRRALSAIRKKEDESLLGHCWLQIGLSYYYLDRYYEAVAALTKLEEPVIKNSNPKLAAEGALRKLMALKKLRAITKDPADQAAYDDFLRWATGAYPRQIGSSGKREAAIGSEDKAAELAGQRKWAEAADKYREAADVWGQIANDPGDPFYEESLFTCGLDWYKRADAFARGGNKGDEAKAVEAFKKALEMFQKHLAYVDKLPPPKDKGVVKNAVGSVLFSCRAYVHRLMNQPQKALDVSNDLDKRFPGAESRFVMSIMSQRIDAKLDLGKMGEAEEDLKLLKAIYQKEGTGVDYLSRALGLLAQGCEEAASKVDREKERELYDSLSIKAATYYYDYFQINPPDPKRDADKLNVIADKLFLAAITRLEKIRATGEKTPEEVRSMFEKARDLFAQYRTSGAKIPDETNQLLRQKEAKCFLETGKFDQAIEIYREIAAADPQMSKGNIHEDLADCYMVQARAMQTGSDRTALIKKADATYGTLAAGLMQNQRINEHFWRLMYKHAECLWETDLELLRSFYGNMDKRGYAPNWDEGKYGYQTKFEDLRKKLEAKLPEKK